MLRARSIETFLIPGRCDFLSTAPFAPKSEPMLLPPPMLAWKHQLLQHVQRSLGFEVKVTLGRRE